MKKFLFAFGLIFMLTMAPFTVGSASADTVADQAVTASVSQASDTEPVAGTSPNESDENGDWGLWGLLGLLGLLGLIGLRKGQQSYGGSTNRGTPQ